MCLLLYIRTISLIRNDENCLLRNIYISEKLLLLGKKNKFNLLSLK